ncbi:MAG TPA: hypothetical protein VM619_14750 [Luteimonas sp.]|nr:hypothetical protein [Luteimonas sp.]
MKKQATYRRRHLFLAIRAALYATDPMVSFALSLREQVRRESGA